MKTRSIARIWPALALLLTLHSHFHTLGQEAWVPIGPPNITSISFQTVGGITYMTHISRLQGCHRVASGPVNRSGTNLFQTISEEVWTGFCICDTELCDPFSEIHVSVFGALPAGGYLLQLSAITYDQPPQPFRWLSFTVPPADNSTLQCSVETNYFNLAVAGIPHVVYTIERSADLTNWASVFTNIGGSFGWSDAIPAATEQRFYRARIIGQ